jgi:hypothetical protein
MQFEAKVLTESIKNTKEQIEKVDKEIEKICGSCEEYTHLLTIPGFGPYVSAVVLAAIGKGLRVDHRIRWTPSLNAPSEFNRAGVRPGDK